MVLGSPGEQIPHPVGNPGLTSSIEEVVVRLFHRGAPFDMAPPVLINLGRVVFPWKSGKVCGRRKGGSGPRVRDVGRWSVYFE
ncbi:hypothetical protein Nans01_36910 [Nocardiopsis ansamitocini]|uniref:Uncharacterized protein n=1 Tax=Nocardiopsis ansamitocini TaxID=1670832 RepID=A0A9W6UKR9_9ACTN|nr:hypothetical protein Nans01_36910 [Nocardiopsis ansamitocini]